MFNKQIKATFFLLCFFTATKAITPDDINKIGDKSLNLLNSIYNNASSLNTDSNIISKIGDIIKHHIQISYFEILKLGSKYNLSLPADLSGELKGIMPTLLVEILSSGFTSQLEKHRITKSLKTKTEENVNTKIDYYIKQVENTISNIKKKLNTSSVKPSYISEPKKQKILKILNNLGYSKLLSILKISKQEQENFEIKVLNLFATIPDNKLNAFEELSTGTTANNFKETISSKSKFCNMFNDISAVLPAKINSAVNDVKAICCTA